MPSARFLDCFVKKLTVMGIMGKTQGVNSAANPNKNPSKNVPTSPSSSSSSWTTSSPSSACSGWHKCWLGGHTSGLPVAETSETAKANGMSSGGKH